jgi:hypothetical protein
MRPSNAIQIDPLWQGLGPHQSGLHEIQNLKASSEHSVARTVSLTALLVRSNNICSSAGNKDRDVWVMWGVEIQR